MIPNKVRELGKGKRQENYDLQVDFCNFENRNVENTYVICEENRAKVCN